MAEYIDRMKVRIAIIDTKWICDQDEDVAYDMIDSIPSADVEEVKHGRWMKDPHTADVCAEYRCSLCGYSYCEADPKHPPFKYCPECGAKNE